MIDPKLWDKALFQSYQANSVLESLVNPKPAAPYTPPPWHRRMLNRVRYRLSEARERLGELVAGRRFDE